MKNRMKIKEAAALMGVSEQYVRIGLQRGLLDIGTAVKMSSVYTYHIVPAKVYKYLEISSAQKMDEGAD